VTAAGASSVALFLRLVRARGLLAVGTADYLRAERLLASREQWTVGELSAALASLLATGEESWRHLHTLAIDTLGLGEEPAAGSGTRDEPPPAPAAVAATSAERPWLQLLPAVALVSAVVAVGVLGPLLWRPAPIPPSPLPPTPPAQEQVEETSAWTLVEIEAARRVETVSRLVRKLGVGDALAFAASFVLLALALRWGKLPEASRRRRQETQDEAARWRIVERDEERARGYARREELARELAESGRSPLVPFKVPELPAVSERAVDDAAVILGRLQHELPGHDDLDADATVAATVAAGGRAVPVFQRGRVQATLLVLVDDERGDHPYLGGFQRVLDRWRRRGVRLLTFTFHEQPDPLWPWPRGAPLSFDVLSRRHGGLPLVIFSRRLTHRGVTAEGAPWTRRLEAWPVKAWIDPDPTRLGAAIRRPGFQQDVAGLQRLGCVRFGLDEPDLPALARFLAEPDGAVRPPRRPLPEIADVEPALRAWAVAAARVPEAGWDLLEHLRSELRDEIGGRLPERRHVALLMRWINERQGTPRRRHGAYLEIEDEEVERLRREQVASERFLPPEKRLLARVARLLLEQLQITRPEDDVRFLRLRWELKRAELELVEAPEKALERLAEFRGSAVDSLAERSARALIAEGSLPAEEREKVARVWSPAEVKSRAAAGATPRELLKGHGALWRRSLAMAAAALTAGWAAGWAASQLAPDLEEVTRDFFLEQRHSRAVGELPRTLRLVEGGILSKTDLRPAMIRIAAGTFLMGSPAAEEGRDDDEDQHQVEITRDYYLAQTEVTQAQYQAVLGENPSNDPQCGGDCPVESVTWLDAVRYANALSRSEDLEPCYQIDGDDVSWQLGLDCLGYRLPTEAEWEDAARAGSADRYAGTGDPAEVCIFANVADAAGKRENPAWAVFECDDGYASLAPVAKFQPNGLGVHDMTGNVWEWVWDWYGSYDGRAMGPIGPPSGRNRVGRGGSFYDDPRGARVAYRNRDEPSTRYANLGFRVARSLP
jgi:formylglycine-generating enzyme required for sulfatase activity